MRDITKQVDNVISKCIEECDFDLPSDVILYSTFFKNAISGVVLSIIMISEDKVDEKEKELKLYTSKVYKKLKAIIKEKGLDEYLSVGKSPYIDNICSKDTVKNELFYNLMAVINIYLSKVDDCFEGYLDLMESEK
jgi:hypothetical protein